MKRLFNLLFDVITKSSIVLLVAVLSVNYVPDNIFADFPLEPKATEVIDFDSVKPQWNNLLSDGNPEYIQLNNIKGPESIAISPSGNLYTSLADGRLVELDPSRNYNMRTVLRIKESTNKCEDNVALRQECGRLLQLRFVNNTLYGIEASTGLYMFDVKSGSKVLLGPKPMSKVSIYNSFAFDPREPNIVYTTLSSTRWSLPQFVWSLIERDSSGRIMAFDTKTGKRAIVADNLMMANGIDIDVKRDQLIFAETLKSRVSSISLEQIRTAFHKASDTDKLSNISVKPLIPLTPGFPDNIIIEGDLAYIALPMVRRHGRELGDQMSSLPKVAKAMGRLSYLAGVLLEYIATKFYKHPLLEHAYRELKTGDVLYRVFDTQTSAVIEQNLATGASRFFGSDAFGCVSEARPDHKGNFYLGSFRSPFIVKQKLPSA